MLNIYLILGLSGSGKTHFANYLSMKKDWIHLNLDHDYELNNEVVSGMDYYKLREPWRILKKENNIEPLMHGFQNYYKLKKKQGIVVSFSSNKILTIEEIIKLKDRALVVYLYSDINNCLNSFLQRERKLIKPRIPKNQIQHWYKHNVQMLKTLSMLKSNKYNTFKVICQP